MWTKSTLGQYVKCSARYECCNGTKLEDLEQWLDHVWKVQGYKKTRNSAKTDNLAKSETVENGWV